MVHLKIFKTAFLILAIGPDMLQGVSDKLIKTESDTVDISPTTWVLVGCVGVLLLVFVVALCGGCTPMEVGSEHHAASGGSKQNYGPTDHVVTDANTRVMNAGVSLQNDPYQPQDNHLPYALHPQGVTTANTFTGYSTQPQGQGNYGNQVSGMGAEQYGHTPGAHRHFSESEPPPPGYDEAIRS